jgi:ribosomal-protein-alanine N-acetyltransferase
MNSRFPGTQIRSMKLEDVPLVYAMAARIAELPRWPLAAYLSALDPEAIPQRIALVADNPVTGMPFGFTMARLVPPQAELEVVAVAPEFQRRGIARRLLAALAEELRYESVTEIDLEVRASNTPALALYRALGFESSGRRPCYYADPEEDAVLMRLALGMRE